VYYLFKLEGAQRVHVSAKWILRPDWNFKFHFCPASHYCVFWCRTLSINVGLLDDGSAFLVSDYPGCPGKKAVKRTQYSNSG